jgi:hypothetical protein
MADPFGKLLVQSPASKRRAAVLAAVAGLAVLYGAFELGRYDAGFRVLNSVRGALSASGRIRDLEEQVNRQRLELAGTDVARRIDREGYKQVERSLGDMQSQIARLTQDLSFYRGLVQPDSLIHVKVQQMQIVPEAADRFRLKFVLMQTGDPKGTVAGNCAVAIDGLLGGKPASITLAQASPNRHGSLAYSFRYFQDYDEPVQLPAGFEPTRIGIEIHSGKDAAHGFRQAFIWRVQGMSMETEAAGGGPGTAGEGVAAPGAAGIGLSGGAVTGPGANNAHSKGSGAGSRAAGRANTEVD